MRIRTRNALAGYSFLLPWLIGFFVFTLYPVYLSIRMSFSSVQIIPGGIELEFIGLDVYNHIWNVDSNFRGFLARDIVFIATAVPFVIVFALVIALLLNGKYRFRTFYRAVFFLPVVIMSGPVMMELMGRVNPEFTTNEGLLAYLFMVLPGAAADAVSFVLGNIVAFLWFSGAQILIFLAGLQKLDRSVYEAAEIDGASGWECFWKLTLPHIKGLILINAIYTVVEIANFAGGVSPLMFYHDQFNTTIGVDMNAFNTVNPYIAMMRDSMTWRYNASAAMSWVYFLAIAAMLAGVYAVFRFFDRGDKV
jgi:ABC-type sugar transport system permease subunit